MFEYWRLVVWSQIWFWIWLFARTIKPKCKENCLTWALKKWSSDDYYLVIRWCRSSRFRLLRWPHFLLLPVKYNKYLIHYVPKQKNSERTYLPSLWFDGELKRGDPPEDCDEN